MYKSSLDVEVNCHQSDVFFTWKYHVVFSGYVLCIWNELFYNKNRLGYRLQRHVATFPFAN